MAICKLYRDIVNEHKNARVEELKENLSEESLGPAWRWLLIREADLEQ